MPRSLHPIVCIPSSTAHVYKPLTEYIDKDDNLEVPRSAHKSICFVECETEAEFKIRCEVKPGYEFTCDEICFRVIIDGAYVTNRYVSKSNFERGRGKVTVSGIYDRLSDTQQSFTAF